MAAPLRKYILDTNCFIDAANNDDAGEAFETFCSWAAPRLYLSSVVAAELRAGARPARTRQRLESELFDPYVRRGRVVTPTAAAWEALGTTLALLGEREGLELRQVKRSFVFDILIAFSAREIGAILVSRNTGDLERIASVFKFEFQKPYPSPA